MESKAFKELLSELDKLTPQQKKEIEEQLHHHDDIQTVMALIEKRMDTGSSCPKCGSSTKIIRWGLSAGLQRYRCGECKATFNALTGTPLARLRHKEKWLSYTQQMADNQSIRKSAHTCSVHRNTSFRWRHRFLALSNEQKATNLTGITEADEAFFLESFKGKKRGMPRAARKRGGKATKRGLSSEQTPVLICRDRTGCTADFVLKKIDKENLSAALKPLIAADAILCSDGEKALAAAARELGIIHRPVNLSAGIRVIGKVYHVQNVNAYGSRLKQWMRQFHGVATRYLENYLGWRRMIERQTEALSPQSILSTALRLNNHQQSMMT